MYKNILILGIISLFILSAIAPLTTGVDSERVEVDIELERMLDKLHFICTGSDDFNSGKYDYYKAQLLNRYSSDFSNDEIVVESGKKDLTLTVKPQLSLIISNGGPMNSPWPIKCHNLHHTCQSPYNTVDTYTEKWRFYSSGWVEDTPVIDNDGIIYFAGEYNYLDHIYAIYPNGTEKWKYKTNALILGSSPAIADDGTIYVGDWGHKLNAIDSNGTLKWKFQAGDTVASSPVIAEDGSIYFGVMGPGENGRIFAVYPNGTEKWHYDTGYWITSDPCIGDDGTVYIGSGDDYFYAMNPDGTLKWRFKTGQYVKGPPSIADDGTVYIGSYDGYLYALFPSNGTMKWKCNIGDGSETNPSIGNDGTIYIGGNYLYAIYPNNGTLKWRFKHSAFIHTSSPAISADGTIYFGTDDTGYIYAVNPDGTQKWCKKIANKWVESSPSIAKDGTVYIGSSVDMGKGYLHAFGPQETNDPPTEPTITGPSEGKVNTEYDFSFKSTDSDRNPVSFYIEWGDGETTGWTKDYASGEKVEYSHSWSEKGNYTIKAKAKDTFGLESDWTEFDIGLIKKDKATNNQLLLLRLLERFPLLQKIFLFPTI